MVYLSMLGIFIPPLGGVIMGDYFFVWKGKIPVLADMEFTQIR
ncbi:MAG: hypothetical protein ACOCV3_02560 [Halanaerobiales bacterium]